MELYLIAAGLLVAGLAKLLWTFIQYTRSPVAAVPGPWYTKYTDVVLTYKFFSGRRAEWVESLHKKYGKVVRLSPTEIDFSSIKAAKVIHSVSNPFTKSSFYSNFDTRNKPSVFSVRDRTVHARYRRLLGGPMSETSLKSVEHIVQGRVDLVMEKISQEMKETGYVDVMKWWLFMATDVIGELSFGKSFQMLEQGKKTQYALDLEAIAPTLGVIATFPNLYYISQRLHLPLFREVITRVDNVRSYAQESIERYDRLVATDPHNVKPTLLTKLFRASEKDEETMSQEELICNAQAFIVAGSDTTAHTMTYLVWLLCKPENIDLKNRLLAEIATLPNEFHNEDLKSLMFLDCIIQETLRLFSAAPAGLPRDVLKGGCEIDGIWVAEGTVVTMQAYSMHRDPVVFPQPERFNPARWENATKEMKDAFMPWGGGSRVCIGLHLAYMELRIATAKFFKTFPNSTLSNAEGFCDDDMKQIIFFLMSPKKKRCLIQAS